MSSQRLEGGVPHLGKRVEDGKIVKLSANEFAAKVSKLEFSPAENLFFLLEQRQSPGKLLIGGMDDEDQ
jgi:hypothetical protein